MIANDSKLFLLILSNGLLYNFLIFKEIKNCKDMLKFIYSHIFFVIQAWTFSCYDIILL